MANRTRALLSKLWTFAMARGLVASNPVTVTERPGVEQPRERVLSDEEIQKLWAVWDSEASLMARLFQMLLLTAQRSGEVKSMAWAEIRDGVWTIPSDNVKNRRSQVVPFSPFALELLERLRAANDGNSPFVFPSTGKSGHLTTLARAAVRYGRKSGVEDWTPHDLRRTVTSHLAEQKVPPHVLEVLLNHAPTGVTNRVYNRYQYRDEVRDALALWSEHVVSLTSD